MRNSHLCVGAHLEGGGCVGADDDGDLGLPCPLGLALAAGPLETQAWKGDRETGRGQSDLILFAIKQWPPPRNSCVDKKAGMNRAIQQVPGQSFASHGLTVTMGDLC